MKLTTPLFLICACAAFGCDESGPVSTTETTSALRIETNPDPSPPSTTPGRSTVAASRVTGDPTAPSRAADPVPTSPPVAAPGNAWSQDPGVASTSATHVTPDRWPSPYATSTSAWGPETPGWTNGADVTNGSTSGATYDVGTTPGWTNGADVTNGSTSGATYDVGTTPGWTNGANVTNGSTSGATVTQGVR